MALSPIIRGSETSVRLVKVSAVAETAGGQTMQALHMYSETVTPGEGTVADDELGGTLHNTVDPSGIAPALPNPAGGIRTPLDLAQIGFWLASMFGAPATSGSASDYTHVFNSGGVQPGLVTLEFPTGNLFRVFDSCCPSQMSLDLAPSDGYRQVDWTLVGRSVRRPSATLSSTITAAPARDKVLGSAGLLKINDTQVGNILGGTFTVATNAFMERYLADTKWPSAVEIGRPSLECSPQIRVRQDIAATLALFDGVTPFKLEILFEKSATRSLSLVCNNVTAEPVLPQSAGLGPMDIRPTFKGAQNGTHPMLIATLKNAVAAY